MVYGMTYEQYWYGSPYMVRTFLDAFRIKTKLKEAEMWRQGIYMLNALNVSLHNNLNFSGKSITPLQYMDKPLEVLEKTAEEKREDAEIEKQKVIDELKSWQKAMKGKYDGNRDTKS
jgi:hypothetical protein